MYTWLCKHWAARERTGGKRDMCTEKNFLTQNPCTVYKQHHESLSLLWEMIEANSLK